MRAAGRKVDQRSLHTDAPAIVLPAPAAQPTRKTVLQIDHFRTRSPDTALRRSLLVDTVIELYEDRIVERIVILRFATYPQAIRNSRLRRELHFHKSSRTRKCIRELRSTRIRVVQTRAARSRRITHHLVIPDARSFRRMQHDLLRSDYGRSAAAATTLRQDRVVIHDRSGRRVHVSLRR